jgi:hypothetical protein
MRGAINRFAVEKTSWEPALFGCRSSCVSMMKAGLKE